MLLHRSFAAQNNIVAQPLRHRIVQPLLGKVEGDDLSRAEQPGGLHGAHPHRACADHRHAVPGRNLGQLRAPVAAGEDVAQKERVLIRNAVGDFGQAPVGKGDPDIFSLAAVDAAAQLPAAIFAVVDKSLLAEPALAAEGNAVGGNPVARTQVGKRTASFDNLPHKFVPQHDALFCARHRTVFDVQVAGADGRAGHPDNGVAGLLEFWRFTFPQGELPLPAVDQRHHRSFHIDRMLLSVVYRSYTTSSDGSTVKPCA